MVKRLKPSLAPRPLWTQAYFGPRYIWAPGILRPNAYFGREYLGPKQLRPDTLWPEDQIFNYSRVPNNSAARLLNFKISSYQHGLIWTYTLIKIQIIFLLTRLLSTIFYFFIYFQCFLQPFFVTITSIMHFFHAFSSF